MINRIVLSVEIAVTVEIAVNDPSRGCSIVEFINESPSGHKFGQ